MAINFERVRSLLDTFEFTNLFVEALGWSRPPKRQPEAMTIAGHSFQRKLVAELAGVVVLEVTSHEKEGRIPDAKLRAAVHKDLAGLYHENLIIFVDETRTQSLWYWMKREGGKSHPREHLFVKGQPGDLFISKLSGIVFDISDFDEAGNLSVVEVAGRLRAALDVERVTRKFFNEFQVLHEEFVFLIDGIEIERDRRWYASVLLHRLMFIYFLQRKGFVDRGEQRYLQEKLAASKRTGEDRYYRSFLGALFFEGFALREADRSPATRKLLGEITYLNGGLFLRHRIEVAHPEINVPDRAFDNLFALFERYSWHLDDTPGGKDDEINPDVLGYIFEKYINQKEFGAYYTRPEITGYLCEQTIHRLILDKINPAEEVSAECPFRDLADLLLNLDARLCRRLLDELPKLSLLDPACGSGAFLVAAMKTLINVYSAVIGRIEFLKDANLTKQLAGWKLDHPSLAYFIKKQIITYNLFGVDIMEEATEIAKLRLFLALVASATTVEQLEPLPNIDFNILAGNSLVGLLRVDDVEFNLRHAQGNLFLKSYAKLVEEKNRLIKDYRDQAFTGEVGNLRGQVDAAKAAARTTLNEILLDEFRKLGIKHEEATWDDRKNDEGKPKKRSLTLADIEALRPFHWGYEFDEILNLRGGFDAIIANPPWETFKPNAKEFFEGHSELVSKKKMTIKEFEKEQANLLKDPEVRTAWLKYLSAYPHVSAWFRSASQFKNQISMVGGKRAGTDINLYKLFVEQSFNLLRTGGECGIVVPGGIYNDLGTKQLREMLFGQARIHSLFGLSNERFLFDGIDHRVKYCLLTFGKGGRTESFAAAFRIDPRVAVSAERLDYFLRAPSEHIDVAVEVVRRLSPESLSVMEFKSERDIIIAEKACLFPVLSYVGEWQLELTNEFHMTNDSALFKAEPRQGRLPLYEGKMIHQFSHQWGQPKYWLDEKEARKVLLSARSKAISSLKNAAHLEESEDNEKPILDYESYRLAFRDVARNTDERTLIAAILPPKVFCPHTMSLETVFRDEVRDGRLLMNVHFIDAQTRFYLLAILNSFVVDYLIRSRVNAHVSFFFIYNLPVPRLTDGHPLFLPIVERAARLTCTTPAFDDLAREIGRKGHVASDGEPVARAKLRAELDGMIAHLYGLTEEEFAHVLSTFPVVADPVKVAARNAFRDVERGLVK